VSRWLVLGAGGMLGRDLVTVLRQREEAVIASTRGDLDVTDGREVGAAVRRHRPDYVVNCAAWTAVDAAEQHPGQALAVNGRGAENVAAACAATGTRLVHLSTDYVFGGDAARPYPEEHPPAPGTAYGRGKLAGENAVLGLLPRSGLVLRTAWLYGAHGASFATTMIERAAGHGPVDVVDDQWGQPTWTVDVARQIAALADAGARPGIYHATSAGETTWCRFAREIFRLLGADPARVRAVGSDRFPRPARRPRYSVLGHDGWARAGVPPIRDWRPALAEALPRLTERAPAPALD
jgi:dTDP-4-dehydrorhamnose reductase